MEIKEFHNLNLFWKVTMKYNFNQIDNSLQKRKLFYGVKSNSTNLVLDLNLIQNNQNLKFKSLFDLKNGPWPIGQPSPPGWV
jgi:hypothetical protein